jgi:hypothetical protein
MWDLLPPVVVASRHTGLQSADWYEKTTLQRPQLQSLVNDLANSQLARRALVVERPADRLDGLVAREDAPVARL